MDKYIFCFVLTVTADLYKQKRNRKCCCTQGFISVTGVTEEMWIVCYIIPYNKKQAITYVLLITVMHAQCYVIPLEGRKCWERKFSLQIATEAAAAARVL